MRFFGLLTAIFCFYNSPLIIDALLVENFDKVPRIMVWHGWVNNHVDETTGWEFQTDPDGVSGANVDKLQYCKKFYPLTVYVRYYSNETSKNWYSRGNIRHPGAEYCIDKCKIASYECIQPFLNNPRIMYLDGYVNQHTSYRTGWKWVSDPDCTSGSNIDPQIYCKKLFPATVFVKTFTREASSSWVDLATGSCNFIGGNISFYCIQKNNFHYY